MKKNTPIWTLVYASAVFCLGILGYQQAGSLASLITGGILGLLVAICAIFMLMNKKIAYYLSTGLVLFLGIFFSIRFSIKQDFLFGSLALFSAIILLLLVLEIYRFYSPGL